MKFTLSYTLDKHGWADAWVACDETSFDISSVSYLSDAFSELGAAVCSLLEGAAESSCAFDHEPGRTKLRFIRVGADVTVQGYKFDRELRDEPWEKGRLVFSCRTTASRLKSQYLNSCRSILAGVSPAEYMERWGHPFPMQLRDRIERATVSAHDS